MTEVPSFTQIMIVINFAYSKHPSIEWQRSLTAPSDSGFHLPVTPLVMFSIDTRHLFLSTCLSPSAPSLLGNLLTFEEGLDSTLKEVHSLMSLLRFLVVQDKEEEEEEEEGGTEMWWLSAAMASSSLSFNLASDVFTSCFELKDEPDCSLDRSVPELDKISWFILVT